MKQTAIFVFALLCLTAARAQQGSGIEFGFGVDAAVPVANDLKDNAKVGFGGEAALGYNFDSRYALLVRAGYMTFITSEYYRNHSVKAIGDGFVKVGGRYTFKKRFYLEPQIGFTRFSGGRGRLKVKSNGFTYAGAAGIFLDKMKTFDISIRYEGTACNDGINFVGLRFTYSLKSGAYF